MNNSRQILFIVVLFLGLMLVAAGIGALVAGEGLIGTIFLVCGILLLVFDTVILVLVRKRTRIVKQESVPEQEQVVETEQNLEKE